MLTTRAVGCEMKDVGLLAIFPSQLLATQSIHGLDMLFQPILPKSRSLECVKHGKPRQETVTFPIVQSSSFPASIEALHLSSPCQTMLLNYAHKSLDFWTTIQGMDKADKPSFYISNRSLPDDVSFDEASN